jgi:hypothetical protein
MDINSEYLNFLNYIFSYDYATYDWNYVNYIINRFANIPSQIHLYNNILINIGICFSNNIIKNGLLVSCPYDAVKFIIRIYNKLPYLDEIKIHNLIFKEVLKCEYCRCQHKTCLFSDPTNNLVLYIQQPANPKYI